MALLDEQQRFVAAAKLVKRTSLLMNFSTATNGGSGSSFPCKRKETQLLSLAAPQIVAKRRGKHHSHPERAGDRGHADERSRIAQIHQHGDKNAAHHGRGEHDKFDQRLSATSLDG
jgi:hypothetical protein